jgi:hypothetical protein
MVGMESIADVESQGIKQIAGIPVFLFDWFRH